MTWLPGDASRAAAAEPSERSDAVAPSWDRAIPPGSPGASRGDYCRDHWPPL
ncbi:MULTISPECIES: hypothetical protein [unclassified Arthrobacter]|uniref:hypothetical protein n=1 Tax=unclassified Arthrobacter TaxID=235627 RepID=UPI000ACEEFA7|nr:hypothetical protein [Arthrobacter sp. 9MFCol3.1]